MLYKVGTLLRCTATSCTGEGHIYEVTGVSDINKTYDFIIHGLSEDSPYRRFTSDNLGFFENKNCFKIKQEMGW